MGRRNNILGGLRDPKRKRRKRSKGRKEEKNIRKEYRRKLREN